MEMAVYTKILVVSLLLVLCPFFSSDVFALDGERKGFILSFGIGPSLTSYTQTLKIPVLGIDETSDRENDFGLGTDFKIGYAPTNQLMIYYTNKVTWIFGFENAAGDKLTIISGVGLLGLSYYLAPSSPSMYFTGTVGVSTWCSFDDLGNVWSGFGIGVGIGYEFVEHWSTELNVIWGNPGKEKKYGELGTNAIGVMLTINGTWY